MSLKQRLIEKALDVGFEDVGFGTTEPMDLYIKEYESRADKYEWVLITEGTDVGIDLKRGALLSQNHPWARTLMVLILNYHRRHFPPQLIGKVGRLYQVEDRQEMKDWYVKVMEFLSFLGEEGVRFFVDEDIPARMAAARAGVADYGKNCFVYANRTMLGASWLISLPILLEPEIEPNEPTIELGCPSWCKNACMAACPTGAIYAPKKMDPWRCIGFETTYGMGMTVREMREPSGTWVYGCDRCQEVCPRNQPWMNQDLPENPSLIARADDFRLETLLTMTQEHYETKVWPLLFYISTENIAKWKMAAARALGNLGDRRHVPSLIQVLSENPDETVRGMCAWALGRLGGSLAKAALESRLPRENGPAKEEIELALMEM
jgi:epoxyqueuosine reductase